MDFDLDLDFDAERRASFEAVERGFVVEGEEEGEEAEQMNNDLGILSFESRVGNLRCAERVVCKSIVVTVLPVLVSIIDNSLCDVASEDGMETSSRKMSSIDCSDPSSLSQAAGGITPAE